MYLAVVIPTTRNTDKLIESIGNQNYLNHDSMRVLIQKEDGLVNARNCGWRNAKNTDIVAFIDDDVILSLNWADEIRNSFKDPQVGCVIGDVLLLGKESRDNDWKNPIMKRFFKRIGNIQACNMAFSMEALKNSNGFDPVYDLGVGEWSEPDLIYKVKSLGFKVIHNDKAKLIHCPSQEGIYKSRAKYSYHRMKNFHIFRKRWLKWDLNLLLVTTIFYLYWVYKFLRTGKKDWLGGLLALR